MPRSTIGDRRTSMFDKATELRNYSAAAVAANASETGIALPASKYGSIRAVVNAAAYTSYVATTAQWTIEIQAATTLNGTYTTVGSVVLTGVQQEFDLPLSGEYIEQRVPGAKFIRANAVKTGTPGALTYGAYLSNVNV